MYTNNIAQSKESSSEAISTEKTGSYKRAKVDQEGISSSDESHRKAAGFQGRSSGTAQGNPTGAREEGEREEAEGSGQGEKIIRLHRLNTATVIRNFGPAVAKSPHSSLLATTQTLASHRR